MKHQRDEGVFKKIYSPPVDLIFKSPFSGWKNVTAWSTSARSQSTPQSKQSFEGQHRPYQSPTQSPASSQNPHIPKETGDESTFNKAIWKVQVPKSNNTSSPNLEKVNLPPVVEPSTTSKQNDTDMENAKYCKEVYETWDFSNKKSDSNRNYRSPKNRKHIELITGNHNNAAELMYSFKDMFLS